jgi:hypothetical protein
MTLELQLRVTKEQRLRLLQAYASLSTCKLTGATDKSSEAQCLLPLQLYAQPAPLSPLTQKQLLPPYTIGLDLTPTLLHEYCRLHTPGTQRYYTQQ